MNSDRQARPARMAAYLRGHRPVLAILSALAVLAVPVLIAVAGSAGGPSKADAAASANDQHNAAIGRTTELIRAKLVDFKLAATTVAPTTAAPTTVAQTTAAPTTAAPTTVAPTTAAPTTAAPTTAAPTTAAPTTAAPTTAAPTTAAPTTTAPTTTAPTTRAPTTVAPTTQAPAPRAPRPQRSTDTGGPTRTVSSTGYCSSGATASGESTHIGGVAMNGVPLGSQWKVLGSGAVYTVNDRIGSGSQFDIFFSSCSAADNYGRQTITIQQVG